MHRDVYTTGQVARLCRVAPRTVSKWFDSGRLKGYRIPGGQDRRIPVAQLRRFLVDSGFDPEVIAKLPTDLPVALLVGMDRREREAVAGELAGHQAESAGNGFEAGMLVRTFGPPALAVIDLAMGRAEGLSVARAVRVAAEGRGEAVRLIGLACEDDPDAAGLLGPFDAAFVRPFDFALLLAAVKEVAGD